MGAETCKRIPFKITNSILASLFKVMVLGRVTKPNQEASYLLKYNCMFVSMKMQAKNSYIFPEKDNVECVQIEAVMFNLSTRMQGLGKGPTEFVDIL